MTHHTYLHAKDLLLFGWEKTKQHYWFIFCTFLIISIVFSAIDKNPVLGILVPLLVGLSLAHISLLIVNNHSFSFGDLVTPIKHPLITLKFLLLAVLMVISVVVGLILLVIPGIYLAVRFKFFPYVVIENPHLSIGDLITRSYMVTEGRFWNVFLMLLVLGVINVLAAFTIVLLLVTIPVSIFATAHMYTKLKH